jgi:hypothetical protein
MMLLAKFLAAALPGFQQRYAFRKLHPNEFILGYRVYDG